MTEGLNWQPGTLVGSALGGYPPPGTQNPNINFAHWTQIISPYAFNAFTEGDAITFTANNSHDPNTATEWECTDWNGEVMSTGPVVVNPADNAANASIAVPNPGKLGWFRLRLIGPVIDPTLGNSYGATTFSIVKADAFMPAVGPYVGHLSLDDIPPNGTNNGYSLKLRALNDSGSWRMQFNTGITTAEAQATMTGYLNDQIADAQYGWNSIAADPARPPRELVYAFSYYVEADAAAVTAALALTTGPVWVEGYNEPNNNYSPQGYLALHESFYAAVKAGNPEALVMGPCAVTMNNPGITFLGQMLALGIKLDGISMHPYNSPPVPGDTWLGTKCADAFVATLTKYGYENLPRFVTENGGCFMADFGPAFMRRQLVQAIQRAIQQDAEFGISYERQCYYYDKEQGFWGQPSWQCNGQWGILGAPDGTPIVPAFRTRSQQLRGKVSTGMQTLGNAQDFMRAYPYASASAHTLVMFATGSMNLAVKLSANKDLVVVDVYGNTLEPVTTDTFYVGETPVYASSATPVTVVDVEHGLMTATNLAPTGTAVVAPGMDATNADRFIANTQWSAYWVNADDDPSTEPYTDHNAVAVPNCWVGVTFAEPITVKRVAPMFAPPWHQQTVATTFKVEAEVGGVWKVILTYADPTLSQVGSIVPFADYGTGCTYEIAGWRCQWNKPFELAEAVENVTALRLVPVDITFGDVPTKILTTNTTGWQGTVPKMMVRDFRIYES